MKAPKWYEDYVEIHDGKEKDTVIHIYNSDKHIACSVCRYCKAKLYDGNKAHELVDTDTEFDNEWNHMMVNHPEQIAMIRLAYE